MLRSLFGACGSDSEPNATGSNTTVAATGELTQFTPTYLPAGYKVTEAAGRQDRAEPAAWSAKVGRPDGDKKFRDLITVLVNPPDSDDTEARRRPPGTKPST